MNITKATKEDLDTILKLNQELFDHESQFVDTYNLNWTYSDIGKKYFSNRLKHTNAIVLVAKDKDQTIGYLVAYIDTYPYRSSNPICEIENMFVASTHRRQKVGSKLVKKCKQIAKEKGAVRLKTEAISDNTTAINFYRKLGLNEHNYILESDL